MMSPASFGIVPRQFGRRSLQRKHECNEIVPLVGGQGIEVISGVRCLAGVQLNRIKNGDVQALVHQPVACTDAPKRRRAQLIG